MSNPPTASLVSANGPSVTSGFPSRMRTERARRGGANWSPVTQTPRAWRSSSQGKLSSSGGSVGSGSVWASMLFPSQQTSSRYFIGRSFSSLGERLTHGRRTRPAGIDISVAAREPPPDHKKRTQASSRRPGYSRYAQQVVEAEGGKDEGF